MPKAFPMGFRRDVVAVARKGDASLMQIAKDFGISESCLHRWLKHADAELLLDKAIEGCRSDWVQEIESLGRTLTTWRQEILNHHTAGASNGPTRA